MPRRSNRAIGDELFIGEQTVKTHSSNQSCLLTPAIALRLHDDMEARSFVRGWLQPMIRPRRRSRNPQVMVT
jgi:hypothetical protein